MQPVNSTNILEGFISYVKATVETAPSTKFQFKAGTTFNEGQMITNELVRAAERRFLCLGGYSVSVSHIGYTNTNSRNQVISGAINIGGRNGVTVGGREVGTATLFISKNILNPAEKNVSVREKKEEAPNEFIEYILNEAADEQQWSAQYISGCTYGRLFTPTNEDLKICKKYLNANGFLACLEKVEGSNTGGEEKLELILLKRTK